MQGEPPSHPELLDWLAVEFMENGWSMKGLLREIVLSATYRQSSRVTPELLKRDPQNRWLARGPRFRMDAEMIRDNALAVAGLLHLKKGGPPIRPPQPEGLWIKVGGRALRLRRQSRRGEVSPRDLRRAQARCALSRPRDLRCHGAPDLRREAVAVEHAAPGAHLAERSGLRRGRAGPGRGGSSTRRRGPRSSRASSTPSASAWPGLRDRRRSPSCARSTRRSAAPPLPTAQRPGPWRDRSPLAAGHPGRGVCVVVCRRLHPHEPRRDHHQGLTGTDSAMSLRTAIPRFVGVSRRHFFRQAGSALGTLSLSTLLAQDLAAGPRPAVDDPLGPRSPHFAPRAGMSSTST